MGAGERDPVVGSDGARQSECLERALEHGEGVDLLRRRQCVAANEIATDEVRDRERVAIAPVGEHELALVIGTPQLVGLIRAGERRALCAPAPARAPRHEPVPVEHRVHVLIAGHGTSGQRCRKRARIVGAPQVG
jgi:hypothetical protein